MKKILIISILFTACSKEYIPPHNDVRLDINSDRFYYRDAVVTSEPFCGSKLHTISAKDPSGSLFLLSVVADTLLPGTYDAGINRYTSSAQYGSHVKLTVSSWPSNASFVGSNCQGLVTIR